MAENFISKDTDELIKDIIQCVDSLSPFLRDHITATKVILKNHATIESVFQNESLFKTETYFLSNSRTNKMMKTLSGAMNSTRTDFIATIQLTSKFFKNLCNYEDFYINESSRIRDLYKDYGKKVKKKFIEYCNLKRKAEAKKFAGQAFNISKIMMAIQTDTKNMADNYLREMASIENLIFTKLFDLFAQYKKDRLTFYSGASSGMKELTKDMELSRIKSDRINEVLNDFVEHPKNYISAKCVFIKSEEFIYPEEENSLDISKTFSENKDSVSISWSKFFSKTPECISLSPGDIIKRISEDWNGWQFGINVTRKTKGWYPSSYVKSLSVIEEVLVKDSN